MIERRPTDIQYRHAYNSRSQYSGNTENHAGLGSHGSQSRPAPDLNHTPSLKSTQYSGYTENYAGLGSHGSQSRPAPDLNHTPSLKPTIHLTYNPSSVDALSSPIPPYSEQHYNQPVPPRQVVQNESAPVNGYVDHRTAARNVVPQGPPNLAPLPHEAEMDGQRNLPPLPPRLENVPAFSDSNIQGQFLIDPRNLDPRLDLSQESNSSATLHTLNFPIPPTLAHTVPSGYGGDGSTLPVSMTPLPVTLNRKHSITRSVYGSEADAYAGIS
jgi:hypothetical protein